MCSRGFTLIEILVSVIILSTAVVFLMQALARSSFALALATKRLNAYAFSAATMADLELAARQGAIPARTGQFRSGPDQFGWRVEPVVSSEDPQLELVTLTVEWHQGRHAYESQTSLLHRLAKAEP